MKKNKANQYVSAGLVDKTTGDDISSGTVLVGVTGDNGSQFTGSGTVTHKGNGLWTYEPTQAETNYDYVVYTFVHLDAITVSVERYPIYLPALGVWEFTVAGVVPSPTGAFDTDLAGNYYDGAFDNAVAIMLTGTAAGERKKVTSYTDSNGNLTLDSDMSGTPTVGDTGILIGRN